MVLVKEERESKRAHVTELRGRGVVEYAHLDGNIADMLETCYWAQLCASRLHRCPTAQLPGCPAQNCTSVS